MLLFGDQIIFLFVVVKEIMSLYVYRVDLQSNRCYLSLLQTSVVEKHPSGFKLTPTYRSCIVLQVDAGSGGAPACTCSGNKRLGARTVRREQRPFTSTWCICHRGGIVGLLLGDTPEITHLYAHKDVTAHLYVLSHPYKHAHTETNL